jgi:hypothetical protein
MTNWYLYILKGGPDKKTKKPLGDAATVKRHMNAAFPGITWQSETEANFPDKRFTLQLGVEKGLVLQVVVGVGKMRVNALASLCKKEGWRLEDPDVEAQEDVDLDDPEGWWMKMHG